MDYLYIDADEDHVSLQFQKKKGDLEKDSRGYKKNCAVAKLIYVYEGIEKDAPESKRHHLVNPYYFVVPMKEPIMKKCGMKCISISSRIMK